MKKNLFLPATVLAAWASLVAPAATAADCPAEALGTARVLTLPRAAAAYGAMQHRRLPLEANEVVLTFDDGPLPDTTPAVLAALRAECVRATFFLNGRPLSQHPQIARQALAEGHSLALHGQNHDSFANMSVSAQRADIDQVSALYQQVLGRAPAAWRYPFLAESQASRDMLAQARLTVMSADLGIEDWIPAATPAALAQRLFDRLEKQGGGIVLLHDAQPQTAQALPLMLAGLRQRGWRVVHLAWAED